MPCKHMLRIDSVIAQALPFEISGSDWDDMVDTKLPVKGDDDAVVEPGT